MVRIISGTHKRILVHPPKGLPVRPTTDRAKESLFNIIENHFDIADLNVLDLFSGTGNMAYEFASRGAKLVIAVDSHPKCISFIKQTSKQLQLEAIQPIQKDAFTFIKSCEQQFDFIFSDAPYAHQQMIEIPRSILQTGILNPNGWLVVEHESLLSLDDQPGFFQKRVYGQSCFSFFKHISE